MKPAGSRMLKAAVNEPENLWWGPCHGGSHSWKNWEGHGQGGSREGFCEQLMKRISHVNTRGKSIRGTWNSMCKGPEAGTSWTCYSGTPRPVWMGEVIKGGGWERTDYMGPRATLPSSPQGHAYGEALGGQAVEPSCWDVAEGLVLSGAGNGWCGVEATACGGSNRTQSSYLCRLRSS